MFPNYTPETFGPSPVPYDWRHKNTIGITTKDRERARRWIIDAMLTGYGVVRLSSRHGAGGGNGSIEQIRKRKLARGE